MANSSGGDRQNIADKLLERAAQDDLLRKRLKDNPKETIEQELGIKLPAHINVKVVEEDHDTVYLVVPADHAPTADTGAELSDDQLAAVAGGAGSQRTYNTAMCCLATIY